MPTYLLLGLTIVLVLLSGWRYRQGRPNQAVGLLMAAALCLRLALAGLDPFLHSWDERYHALVAKNMLTDWTRPLLRADPVLPYDYQAWCCNHVWLHKQPLFLWQVAASLKLFGVNELAVRLPSVVLGALLVWPVYRLGRMVFDVAVGYHAALLLVMAYYQLELTAGWQSVDHGDVAFLAYVTASVWAYYESRRLNARPLSWVLLTGAFAGAAVLCKWLPGLVVYAGWLLDVLLSRRQNAREYLRLLLSLLIAVAIFLPWQLYIQNHFPLESAFEQDYAAQHFGQVLEGKGGPWYFYLANLWYQFQWLTLLLAAGLGLVVTGRFRQRPLVPLLTVIGVVFVFFSLAATKMPSYTYVVAPLLFLLMALAWVEAERWLSSQKTNWAWAATIVLAGLIVTLSLRPTALLKHHTLASAPPAIRAERQQKIQHTEVYRRLDALVPSGYVVLNAPDLEDVEAMFYSHRNVYTWWPSEAEYRVLRAQGKGVAMFPARADQVLPAYLREHDVLLIATDLE